MYKVFFNDRLILLSGKEKPEVNDVTGEIWPVINTPAELDPILHCFFEGHEQRLRLCSYRETDLWMIFRHRFTEVPAAGGIVLKEGTILLIFRNGKWDLPKGKIDQGETPAAAAIREVREECGIDRLTITRNLPSTFHIYKTDFSGPSGKWVLKETMWFEMEYHGRKCPRPNGDEGITKAEWMEAGMIKKIFPEIWPSLQPLISSYF